MESKTKVLLVEDEALIAADVSKHLDRLGYQVSAIATEGEEAYLAASASQPDVVLMDIDLHGTVDGIEAAAKIYTDLRIPVVFLTAHDDLCTLQRAQGADPFGYLTKPAAAADLANSIEIALQRHRNHSAQQLRELWLETQLRSVGEGLLAAGPDGTVRFLNAEGERLLGVSGLEVVGKDFRSVVSLRHRGTGKPAADLVRLTFLRGATTDLGKDYVVDRGGVERRITGELAIAKVGEEPVGVVFTFRDITVESQGGFVPGTARVEAERDCSRTAIHLDRILSATGPRLQARLLPGNQLKITSDEPVLPILGNTLLVESLLSGLIEKVQDNAGPRVSIRISTTDLDFERRGTDGSTTRYVRLQFAYQYLSQRVSEDNEMLLVRTKRPGIRLDTSWAGVQSALQSLRATTDVVSSPDCIQWNIFFPVFSSDTTKSDQESSASVVILIEPDAEVRSVLCHYLSGDNYECLGARDVQEAIGWIQSFPAQIDVIVLPETNSAEVQSLLEESPASSILLVTKDNMPETKLIGELAPVSVIDFLFSKDDLRAKLDEILLVRAKRQLT